jgi:hypothetical protein
MIPLRRILTTRATNCRTRGDRLRRGPGAFGPQARTWIFRGIAVAAAVKLATGLLFLFPSELSARLPVLPNAVVALEVAPALIAVGYILGYRQSGVLVAGSLVSALVLIPLITWVGGGLPAPLFPETVKVVSKMSASDIWSRYVRYIGAGAVAVAGLLTVARNLPTMGGAFAGAVRGSAQDQERRGVGRRDGPHLPGSSSWALILFVIAVAAFVPGVSPAGWGRFPARSAPPAWRCSGSFARSPRVSWESSASPRSPRPESAVTLLGVASVCRGGMDGAGGARRS